MTRQFYPSPAPGTHLVSVSTEDSITGNVGLFDLPPASLYQFPVDAIKIFLLQTSAALQCKWSAVVYRF